MNHTIWDILIIWPIVVVIELSTAAFFIWTVKKTDSKNKIG
jgi:hypothetical protein